MTGFALIASVVDGFHCVAFAMTLHLVVPYKKYYMFFIGMFHFAFLIQNGRTIALPSYSLFTIHSSLFTFLSLDTASGYTLHNVLAKEDEYKEERK